MWGKTCICSGGLEKGYCVEDGSQGKWTAELSFFMEDFLDYIRGLEERVVDMSYVEMKALSGIMEELDFIWGMAQVEKKAANG